MSEDTVVTTTTDSQAAANTAAQDVLNTASQEHRASASEQRARELGWRPKEEFNGDEEHVWVDAGEFLRRGELIDKIKTLSKKNKDTDRTMALLVEHHKKVRETEFQRAIQHLKSQRKEALVQGDVDKVLQLEEQESQVKDKFQEFKEEIRQAAAANEGPPPEFYEFVERNKWYQKDQEATMDADAIGARYRAANPNADYEDVLNYVEKKIKALHPNLFKSKPSASAVDSGSTSNGQRQSSKNDTSWMNQEEIAAMKRFARTKDSSGNPLISEEQYMAELKRVRNL